MSTKLYEYSEMLRARYMARDSGRLEEEEEILSTLDRLWISMSEKERLQSDDVAIATKRDYNFRRKMMTHFDEFHSWVSSENHGRRVGQSIVTVIPMGGSHVFGDTLFHLAGGVAIEGTLFPGTAQPMLAVA
ncbi:hypothetical protein LN461_14135 [Xanthomonas arboricola]|uniref:hypothetical protein n=1 Tax=Xanthomonas arboricola TaxID=56448 RepID=UPI001E506418|nr:hypothetical protein [Xanthomonas arboricola]MCC8670473.1 hypothetical protein [Xanthomonas arboricola]